MPYLDHWGTYEQRARANVANQNGGDMRITQPDDRLYKYDHTPSERDAVEVSRILAITEVLDRAPGHALVFSRYDLALMRDTLNDRLREHVDTYGPGGPAEIDRRMRGMESGRAE